MKTNIHLFNLSVKLWIFLSLFLLLPVIVQACHDGCGGSLACSCDSYSQGGYYSQSGYYTQSGYYSQGSYYTQSGYYTQASYYLQGGYWAAISQAWVRVSPQITRYGDDVTVTWSGGNAAACTLSGGGLSSSAIVGTSTLTGASGEAVISIVCTLGPNTSRASTTVKVIPLPRESYNTGGVFDFFKSQVASVIAWFQ